LLQQVASDTTVPEHIIRWAERAQWRTIQRMRLLDVITEPQSLLAQTCVTELAAAGGGFTRPYPGPGGTARVRVAG